MPAVDMPLDAQVEEMLCIAIGGVDSYDFHAIEAIRSIAERRDGGETDIAAVQALRGAGDWNAGGWSPSSPRTTSAESDWKSSASRSIRPSPACSPGGFLPIASHRLPDGALSQALHLINGETTTGKIAEGRVVERLLAEVGKPAAVDEMLYLRCLARAPTSAEAERIASKLDAAPDRMKTLQDLFWALLNSNEFLFNH
jgi:hypothetical protein